MFESGNSDDPIIVTGTGRSGTTWMQWLLSHHPRIHIHGQLPALPFTVLSEWYEKLVAQGQWAQESNARLSYEIAHYAGSDKERCRDVFREMFRGYMTGFGPEKPDRKSVV